MAIDETAKTSPAAVAAALEHDTSITHVGLIQSETASGIVHDVDAIGEVVRGHGRRMIVDAVSAFGALPLDMAAHPEIDAAVFTANKCLEGFPGVAYAIARIDRLRQCAGHCRQLVVRSVRCVRPCRYSRRWPPAFHAARANRQRTERGAGYSGSRGRTGSPVARAIPRTCATLYDGMSRLGIRPFLPLKHQGPVIVNVHAPDDPAWHLQAFVDALKSRGVLISNFYNTPNAGLSGRLHRRDHAGRHGGRGRGDATWPLQDIGVNNRAAETMNPDLDIARAATLQPIADIAARLGIPADALEPYGRHKAKIGFDFIDRSGRPEGRRAGAGHRHQPDPRR